MYSWMTIVANILYNTPWFFSLSIMWSLQYSVVVVMTTVAHRAGESRPCPLLSSVGKEGEKEIRRADCEWGKEREMNMQGREVPYLTSPTGAWCAGKTTNTGQRSSQQHTNTVCWLHLPQMMTTTFPSAKTYKCITFMIYISLPRCAVKSTTQNS